jgi:hypothetical protein
MSMLAAPDTIAGPLTAAALAESRRFNAGNVHFLHRASACTGNCRQGRDCTCTPDTVPTDYSVPGWLDSCAPEGGKHADPVPSGTHRHTLISRAWLWLTRWI